ncbi:uncharacterized protein LOC127813784 isoform X2 [Diospyros lotus]|nr:uncharacterized protein LOC127813784 isoform X2 [Diospyros lotus]
MGKRGSNKKATNPPAFASLTLREESRGKRQTSVNPKLMLKLEHVQNLAVWAASKASIPSLAALFGHQLATLREATGSAPDPSLFSCRRCGSILQPGYNCTVRIEKNTSKARHRRKRPIVPTQNNVVNRCHFCSYPNMLRGTPRRHMKEICPPKPKAKPSLKQEPPRSAVLKPVNSEGVGMGNLEIEKMDDIASPAMTNDDHIMISSTTPLIKMHATLLDSKRRKRNRSGSKKVAESESNPDMADAEQSVSTSSKRKRKSWTSLKEIAEDNGRDSSRNLAHLRVPFFL